jgi:hypothetical protein
LLQKIRKSSGRILKRNTIRIISYNQLFGFIIYE